jgi:hypothetical protein
MRNQFIFTINITEPGPDNGPGIPRIAQSSFNMDKVVRTFEKPDGGLIVILDDFHERTETQPDKLNVRTNRVIHGKKETFIAYSELHMSKEDKERFFKLTNIEQ